MAYTASFDGGLSATLSVGKHIPAAGRPRDELAEQRLQLSKLRRPDLLRANAGRTWVGADPRQGELGRGADRRGALHDVTCEAQRLRRLADGEGAYGRLGGARGRQDPDARARRRRRLQMQAVYSRNAIWYSGIPEEMVNENGQTNGNGQQQFLADAYFNGRSWGVPSAGRSTPISSTTSRRSSTSIRRPRSPASNGAIRAGSSRPA